MLALGQGKHLAPTIDQCRLPMVVQPFSQIVKFTNRTLISTWIAEMLTKIRSHHVQSDQEFGLCFKWRMRPRHHQTAKQILRKAEVKYAGLEHDEFSGGTYLWHDGVLSSIQKSMLNSPGDLQPLCSNYARGLGGLCTGQKIVDNNCPPHLLAIR
ncbi:hypothetical protein JHK85_032901 [Glycine max]|nr:hypothetical protein JHK85_032901 [Glycine max]